MWHLGEPLTELEERMVRAAAGSGVLEDVDGGPYDLDAMRSWGPDRTIRGEVLRHLLVADTWEVQESGLSLSGVVIDGPLDLILATVRCGLGLAHCLFDGEEPVRLAYSTVSRLVIIGCHLPGLDADGMVATKGVLVRDSVVAGHVRLADATITGGLELEGTSITGKDAKGRALFAERITVRGDLALHHGFTTTGAVRLIGAQITGALLMGEARIGGSDAQGNALVADGIAVGGSVFLRTDFAATGTVRLIGATIGGQVNCTGAHLTGTDTDGQVLVADGVSVRGDMFLDGVTAAGAISMRDAAIGGSLTVEGAEIAGPSALLAAGAHVENEFVWAPRSPVTGTVDLERMTIGRLTENWARPGAHWPPAGSLRITGFAYEGFGARATIAQRLDWIRRQETFASQPYEHLADVYRQTGQDTDARKVAIARRNDLRTYGALTPVRRASSRILDVTVKHGYEPWRAVLFLLAVYAIVLGVFWHAQHRQGAMVPARSGTTLPVDSARHCRAGYPCFYPATYALDVVVPILDVRDADAWRPRGGGFVAVTVLATALGWAFSTLAVLGYTGIVRKE